jgi:hypothetical protein
MEEDNNRRGAGKLGNLRQDSFVPIFLIRLLLLPVRLGTLILFC